MQRFRTEEGNQGLVFDGTTLLFGLPGVRVERVERLPDGTRVVHAVTADQTAAACPSCGVFSTSAKGRVTTSPKDIPYGEGRIIVRWNKTRWRCREDYCTRASFTETIAQVPARARTTQRLRAQIGAAVGDAARSVTEVAAAHGVSWPTAHRAFVAHAEAVLTEPEPTRVLGIDETRRGKPRWEYCAETGRWVRVDPWDTGFVDLAGVQGLLGQREGLTGSAVVAWLSERTPEFREAVELVAIDPRRRQQPIPRPDDPAPRDFGSPAITGFGFFRHFDVLSLNSPGAHVLPIGPTRWSGPPRAHQRPDLAHQRRRDDDMACDPKLASDVRDIEVAALVATGHERLGIVNLELGERHFL